MREYEKIKAVIMRGGTSKGVFIMSNDLPEEQAERDGVILRIFGSPDIRQIDGLGGADPLTSKLAIIRPSLKKDADVDYTFGYVSLEKAHVDYNGNCGNISSAVGPFAIEEGLVKAVEPVTVVRIYNTNTKKMIHAEVPVKDGWPVISGGFSIDGVPRSGAKILLNFPNAQGAVTGRLLPTGRVVDEILLKDGRSVRVSMVDAAVPGIYVQAAELGFTGAELPRDFVQRPELLDVMEEIRVIGADRMGLVGSEDGRKIVSPAVPKVGIVGKARAYETIYGKTILESDIDLVARTKALGILHKAYSITGGISLAVASMIPGTVANELLGLEVMERGTVRLGHPSGVLGFDVKLEGESIRDIAPVKVALGRTARRIMDGYVYVPNF